MKVTKILGFVLALIFILTAVSGGSTATTVAPSAVPPTTVPLLTTDTGYVIPAQNCAPNCTYKDMVVGFIQTGPEGAWRTENNASFSEAHEQLGITLKVYASQGKVENQS